MSASSGPIVCSVRPTRRSRHVGVLAAGLVLVLSSCATVPAPHGADDALVIGHLVLDFPEGFGGGSNRSIQSYVLLRFVDTTANRRFCRLTRDGYYCFLGEPGHRYLLRGFQHSLSEEGAEYDTRDRLALAMSMTPGQVSYQGHLTVRYARPSPSNKPAVLSVTTIQDVEWPAPAPGAEPLVLLVRSRAYWTYERSLERVYVEEALIDYLRRRHPRSPWLAREIAR